MEFHDELGDVAVLCCIFPVNVGNDRSLDRLNTWRDLLRGGEIV